MKETKYRVNEIFYSIDGEGLRAGSLAVFIRLAGCNLRCSYCDTAYALKAEQGGLMTINEICNEVLKYHCKHVTLTGGEPLLHDCMPLIKRLKSYGIHTNIETNGSMWIGPYLKRYTTITMDWKTPASGEESSMLQANLRMLRKNDVLKFVCNRSDLPEVANVLKTFRPKCWIYLSPIFGKIEPARLVDFLKGNDLDTEKMRVQVQLHKIIWNPKTRGV